MNAVQHKEKISGLDPHVSITDTEESVFAVYQKRNFHFDFLYNCIHLIQNHTLKQTYVQKLGTFRAFTDSQLE